MNVLERKREDFAETVVCPICGAQPGRRCRYPKPGAVRLQSQPYSHLGRLKVARGERL